MSYEDHVHYRERERHGRAMAEIAQVRTFAAGARSLHRSMPDVRLSTAALTSFRAPSEP